MAYRRIILAGTHSGVGKTTVTLGLLAALVRRREHSRLIADPQIGNEGQRTGGASPFLYDSRTDAVAILVESELEKKGRARRSPPTHGRRCGAQLHERAD